MTRLAAVVDFPTPPSPHARPLRYRAHLARPDLGQPIACTEFRIEQQLSDLWDLGMDPAWFLGCFTPDQARVLAPLVEALYDAADAVADAELRAGAWSCADAYDRHDDCLHDLALAVRQTVTS